MGAHDSVGEVGGAVGVVDETQVEGGFTGEVGAGRKSRGEVEDLVVKKDGKLEETELVKGPADIVRRFCLCKGVSLLLTADSLVLKQKGKRLCHH